MRSSLDTPIRIDCTGRVRPGLASVWSKDASGRTWTFTIQDDARGSDRLPLNAHRIVAAWSGRQLLGTSGLIHSVIALDDRRLAVTMNEPHDTVPSVLADPAFSIPLAGDRRPGGVRFEQLTGEDPRDALDRGADILVTRDPEVLEYAAARPELVSFPLPWTRTYVLFGMGNLADTLSRAMTDPQVRRSLADAVGLDARPAEPPFWWNELTACTRDTAAVSQHQAPRIVYPLGDDVARQLAERALALTPSETGLRTVALAPAELAAALRRGAHRAFVLAVPRQTLAPCRDSSAWPRATSILPLIDVRSFVIVRRGSPPLTVDWDGTIRIEPAEGDDAP